MYLGKASKKKWWNFPPRIGHHPPTPVLQRAEGVGLGTGISPGGLRISQSLTPNSFSSLQDRMEVDRHEKEKRDRELAELRDRENRMRDEMFRRGGLRLPGLPPTDPYMEASRRFG